MQPFTDSTADLANTETLRARMRAEGYLFLRNLIPAQTIAALQLQIAEIAQQAGWLLPNTNPALALANPEGFCVDPDPTYLRTLRAINHLEAYHSLKHHPALITLLERLLGGPILPHPRVLCRNIFPARDEFTTKSHQDYPNVQGTTEVYTAWMPLIDCPIEVGPLQVAAGTHTGEIYDFTIAQGAGGIEITNDFPNQWKTAPFQQGDVLLFHSLTVHKGIPNHSNRLRMSIDVRYQLLSEPFNPDNANPDAQPLTWESIYANWQSPTLQYYWQRLPLTLTNFNQTWLNKRDALGFTLGEARNPRARSVLQRIAARDADPAKRARAEALLAALPEK